MTICWLSDVHFEFLPDCEVLNFLVGVAQRRCDLVLITGDISNGLLIQEHLLMISRLLPKTLLLLGNHDFYHKGIAEVRQSVAQFCRLNPNVLQLGDGEIISLPGHTALIGTAGWADGRAGLGALSQVRMTDFSVIDDFKHLSTSELFAHLGALGSESAKYVLEVGQDALAEADTLVIATHVPPFRRSSLYEGLPSNRHFAPFFVNYGMGEAIRELAENNPEKQILVLAGHTHHRADLQLTSNIRVRVAEATYRRPQIEDILRFGSNYLMRM